MLSAAFLNTCWSGWLFHTVKIAATLKNTPFSLNFNFDISEVVYVCPHFPIREVTAPSAAFVAFQWKSKALLKLNRFPCLGTIPLLSLQMSHHTVTSEATILQDCSAETEGERKKNEEEKRNMKWVEWKLTYHRRHKSIQLSHRCSTVCSLIWPHQYVIQITERRERGGGCDTNFSQDSKKKPHKYLEVALSLLGTHWCRVTV